MTSQTEPIAVATESVVWVPNATTATAARPDSPSTPQADSRIADIGEGGRIDWNTHHPDGSDASLRKLLSDIADRFSVDAIFGKSVSQARRSLILSSDPQWTSNPQLAMHLKSSLVEASLAKQSLLAASESGHSSAVLENLRVAERLQLIIGFAIQEPSSPFTDSGILLTKRTCERQQLTELTQCLPQLRCSITKWLTLWQICREAQEMKRWYFLPALWSGHRSRIVATTCIATMCLLMLPVPYWPGRECVLEPAERRFVASPINGRVLKSLVRPGDLVDAGQAIGQMDDEQLRWELGTAEAELQAASKHQDSALANQEGGKLRLAQFEHQKIALRIRELQSQLSRLELASPIAGVVLQGDWYRSEGAPVNRGDILFEVAPLERMTVQIHLTTEDLSQIQVGDLVTLRIDNAVGQSWQGTISRIDPRAEVIDDAIRFVAEVELFNRDNYLRPGMKGSARIDAGTRTIGWLLLQRPFVWLMKTIVW